MLWPDIARPPFEGLALRSTARLQVQHPGKATLQIDGVWLDLAVRGLGPASGVSPVDVSLPRFGETVIDVPVTVSDPATLRRAWGPAGTAPARAQRAGAGAGTTASNSRRSNR